MPPEFLVDGLVLSGAITAFVGIPYSGKTALAIDTVVQAAHSYRVLLVEEEGQEFELQHKLTLAGLDEELRKRVSILWASGINLSEERWRMHFELLLSETDLVVLDSFSDVQSADALDPRQMDEFMKWLRECVRRQKKTCVVLAHSPKAVVASKENPRLADLFGSQTIGAKLDAAFVVRDFRPPTKHKQRDEEEEDTHDNPFKEVWCVKLRGFGGRKPRVGRIDEVEIAGVFDSKGRQQTVGVWKWEAVTPAQKRGETKALEAMQPVEDALRAFGPQKSAAALYKRMAPAEGQPSNRPSKPAFFGAIKRLKDMGIVEDDGEGGIRMALDAIPPPPGGFKPRYQPPTVPEVPGGSTQVPEPHAESQLVPGSEVPPPEGWNRNREPTSAPHTQAKNQKPVPVLKAEILPEAQPALAPAKCLGLDSGKPCPVEPVARYGHAWCARHGPAAEAMRQLDPDWQPDGAPERPGPTGETYTVELELAPPNVEAVAILQRAVDSAVADTSDPQGSLTVEDVWPTEK